VVAELAATTAWDSLHLLEGVREVALLVDPVDLTAVTQRTFDEARSRCPGFERLPAARNVCRRLDLPWATVLELAALRPAKRPRVLGRLQGERENAELTPEVLTYALRLVAQRVQKSTITPGEYDAERDELMAADRRHYRNESLLWLPTANQVRVFAGSWIHALAHAELSRGQARGGQLPNQGRTPTVIDVLDRCYEHHGVEATYTQLLAFARANKVPMKAREKGKPWAEYVQEWRAERQRHGLSEPAGPAPRGAAPDFNQDVGAALPGERRRRYEPDYDNAVDWVVRYLQGLQLGQRPGSRRYDQWARRHNGAPWTSEFRRHHGGWLNVLRAAQARLRAAGPKKAGA